MALYIKCKSLSHGHSVLNNFEYLKLFLIINVQPLDLELNFEHKKHKIQANIYLLKANNRNVNDAVLVSLPLTSIIFHTFF